MKRVPYLLDLPNTSDKDCTEDDLSNTASESDQELHTASEDADNSEQDSSEDEHHRRPGRYTMDPILKTPPNLTPARMKDHKD